MNRRCFLKRLIASAIVLSDSSLGMLLPSGGYLVSQNDREVQVASLANRSVLIFEPWKIQSKDTWDRIIQLGGEAK